VGQFWVQINRCQHIVFISESKSSSLTNPTNTQPTRKGFFNADIADRYWSDPIGEAADLSCVLFGVKKTLSEPDRGFLSWIGIGFRALSP